VPVGLQRVGVPAAAIRASIRCACSRSRSGSAATSVSSSPITSRWRGGEVALDRQLERAQSRHLEPTDLGRGER
jgi:hypothetical protein